MTLQISNASIWQHCKKNVGHQIFKNTNLQMPITSGRNVLSWPVSFSRSAMRWKLYVWVSDKRLEKQVCLKWNQEECPTHLNWHIRSILLNQLHTAIVLEVQLVLIIDASAEGKIVKIFFSELLESSSLVATCIAYWLLSQSSLQCSKP